MGGARRGQERRHAVKDGYQPSRRDIEARHGSINGGVMGDEHERSNRVVGSGHEINDRICGRHGERYAVVGQPHQGSHRRREGNAHKSDEEVEEP